jgi:hypothetical protein
MRTLLSTSSAGARSPPVPLPLMKSAYCLSVKTSALPSPIARAIRSAALVPDGRLISPRLVAREGAKRSHFGVPA